MFTADPDITDLNVREKNIHMALFSMNIHEVATPELSVEDARCYILLFRDGGQFMAFAALYMPRTDRRFFYSSTSNPFREEDVAAAVEEARGFAEDMGFVLDEIHLENLSIAEKNRWIDEQDIFSRKKKGEEKATARTDAGAQDVAAPAQDEPTAVQFPDLQSPSPDAVAEPQPKKRTAAQAGRKVAADQQPQAEAPPSPPKQRNNVLQQAVKENIVKPPKQQLKKDIQAMTGVVSRDKEALVRLLTSF